MEPIPRRAVVLAILGATAGCRLGPLVDDPPGASAGVLPRSAILPGVMLADLQIQLVECGP